jgi:imidazolonepropionase-like amidohydrolase
MRQPSISAGAAWIGWIAAVLILGAVAALPVNLAAQAPRDTPQPPPYYAVTNARIVTVSGSIIERGTVVIANGLIAAVGTNVTVPPEAWVIDGQGLTVYPGLIDGLTDVGLPRPEGAAGARAAAQSGGSTTAAAQGPEDRPATFSWRAAADDLTTDDSRIASWREGGFTTVLSVPSDGLVTGQGAVLSLRDGRPEEMVVKTPAALRLNLSSGRGFRGYPGSLFAVIAYHKQLFLDADHYAQATAADRVRPAGLDRPTYDRTLDPLGRAVAEGWPVLIPGDEPKEILRALTLGSALGVRTVVYGAQHAYDVSDELARAGAPVLVSLDWPDRPRDVDPDAEESLSSLRARSWAPSAPGALDEAGVRFAFYSEGVASPREALEKVRAAVEAGLSPEAALRALTLGAAEIYGVADRLGSIERGKSTRSAKRPGPRKRRPPISPAPGCSPRPRPAARRSRRPN